MFGLQTIGNLFGFGKSADIPYPVTPPKQVTSEQIINTAYQLFGPPARPKLADDQIVSDIIVVPYYNQLDLDNYGRETYAERRDYRYQYRRDPVIRSAILGKTSSLSCLDVTVLPGDSYTPQEKRLANEVADWVDHTVSQSRDGWSGVIDSIFGAAPIDGFTVCPFKLKECNWRGRDLWGFDHIRQLDTLAYIRLQTDVYRNVIAIVNTVRGLEYYSPGQAVIYSHNPQYSNPFGQPDMTSVSQASSVIETAYRAWVVAVEVYGLPYMVAVAGKPTQKQALQAVLENLRKGGYTTIEKDDDIKVLNLAAASGMNGFKDLIHSRREDIFFGVRGVATPYMEGDGGNDAHGDTETEKGSSDKRDQRDAKRVASCIQHQLIPWLVKPNFGDDAPLPTILLGGIDYKRIKDVTSVFVDLREKLGFDPSRAFVQKVLCVPESRDEEDRFGLSEEEEKDNTSVMQAIASVSVQVKAGQLDATAGRAILMWSYPNKITADWVLKIIPDLPPPPTSPQQTAPPQQLSASGGNAGLQDLVRDSQQPRTFSDLHTDDSIMTVGRRLIDREWELALSNKA